MYYDILFIQKVNFNLAIRLSKMYINIDNKVFK